MLSIGTTLNEIFTDENVKAAAKTCVDKFAYFLGSLAGGLIAIGAAWLNNILTGFAQALENKKEWLKEQFVKIFNNISFTLDDLTAFWQALVEIITKAFNDPNSIGITQDIFEIAITLTVGSITLATDFVKDVIHLFTKPIIDNKEKIEKNISDTFATIKPGFDTLKDEVQKVVDKMEDSMENHISPFFNALADKASEKFGEFNDSYNEKMIPALDDMTTKFQVATIALGLFFDDLKTLNDYMFDVFTVNIENDWKPAMLGMRISFNLAKKKIAEGLADLLEKWGANKAEVASFKWVLENEFLPSFDDASTAVQNFYNKLDLIGKWFLQTWPQAINNWKTGMNDIKKAIKDFPTDFFNGFLGGGVLGAGANRANAQGINQGLKGTETAKGIYINLMELDKALGKGMHLPGYAKGGVITSPQLAMIGERGSEAVMPLEQNTGWIDVLANKLAGIMSTRSITNRSGIAEDRPVEIVLQLGDAKFGKAVIQSINKLQNQTGKLLLDL